MPSTSPPRLPAPVRLSPDRASPLNALTDRRDIIVIAASARALSTAARAAGFKVRAIDLFADADTRAASEDWFKVTGCLGALDEESVLQALDALDPTASMPVVFGGVIDTQFELLRTVGATRRLLGSPPETLAALYHPMRFARRLVALGIAHPKTQLRPPSVDTNSDANDGCHWLVKRKGASGGDHVHTLDACVRAGECTQEHYYQRRVVGLSLSVTALASARSVTIVGFADQGSRSGPNSFRFEGAVAMPKRTIRRTHRESIYATVAKATAAYALRGLVSYDFVVGDDGPVLIEINPRPSANFELFDDGGRLFRSHVLAWLGARPQLNKQGKQADDSLRDPREVLPIKFPLSVEPRLLRGFRVVYARRPVAVAADTDWPPWVKDRPVAGSRVGDGEPLCTVHASAKTTKAIHERLGECENAVLQLLDQAHNTRGQVA